MTRRDPGAAESGIPREPGRCACRHLESFHTITAKGRATCSASTCGCRHYQEVTP